MTSSPTPLMLPLAALFVAFFAAPLIVLLALSLHADTTTATWTAANYGKFFTDRFNYSILWDTLFLGVKATLVCLVFGYPIAWICARVSARWQSVLVFLVILPILTSVVMVLAQVQMPLMVLPILTVLSKIDPNLADASRVLGAGEWRTLWRVTVPLSLPGVIADPADGAADPHRAVEDRPESGGRIAGARGRRMAHALAGDGAVVAAGRDRRLHLDLFGLRHRVRDPNADRRGAADLHALAHLSAGDRRQQLAVRGGDLGHLHGRRACRGRTSESARTQERELW